MTTTADDLLKSINLVKQTALSELNTVTDSLQLEEWRVNYLGRRDGRVNQILRSITSLPERDRKEIGTLANDLRVLVEGLATNKLESLRKAQTVDSLDSSSFDVTLPGHPPRMGRLHPTTQIVREICSAFSAMGFQILEGPEIETDQYNFELLNIPKDHPARDMWNTLWIDFTDENGDQPYLLRTHTSPMQARIMEKSQPPIRVVIPGKCYRYEATDTTHEWHFFQVEGLAVAQKITFSDLKGTLYEFAKRVFGEDRQVRFRCDYFPFVEPGVDMSIDCFNCSGNGSAESPVQSCRICRGTGWIEIMGAGMIHPNVLAGVGIDPNLYSGFAFGLGPERISMLKYSIEDIRLFYANDLRFLRQF